MHSFSSFFSAIRILSLLGLVVTLGATSALAESDDWARAVEIIGTVSLVDPESGDRKPVKKGDRIGRGARIATGEESQAVFLFSNGAAVTLGAETEAALEEVDEEETSVELDYGEVFGNVERLDERSRFSVTTPLGVAGIRGTTFLVYYDPDAAVAMVTNVEGSVVWVTPDEVIEVEEGTELVIWFSVDDGGEIEIVEQFVQPLAPEEARRIIGALRAGILARLGIPDSPAVPYPVPEFDGSILSPARQ